MERYPKPRPKGRVSAVKGDLRRLGPYGLHGSVLSWPTFPYADSSATEFLIIALQRICLSRSLFLPEYVLRAVRK